MSGVSPLWFMIVMSEPWLTKQFMAGMCPDDAQCAGVFPVSKTRFKFTQLSDA